MRQPEATRLFEHTGLKANDREAVLHEMNTEGLY